MNEDDFSTTDDADETEDDDWYSSPVEIPIDGVLDLHTFSPKELPELLDDYLAACADKGILDVRIIHGKGKGVLRKRVRAILARHPLVAEWSEAPLEAGGWGATTVRLTSQQ